MENKKNAVKILGIMYKITPFLYITNIMNLKKDCQSYKLVEFAFIAGFLLIPPLFPNPFSDGQLKNPFSWNVIICFLVSVILYIQYKPDNCLRKKKSVFFQNVMNSAFFFKTFGCLVVTFACLNYLCSFFGWSKNGLNVDFSQVNPFSVLLTFLFTCFYEEIMYRLYFPAFLKENFTFKNSGFILEIIPIAVFALSHRYMGWAAVLNAFAAGFFLRRTFLKTDSIFTCFACHFFYNAFVFLLACFIN